MAFMRWQSCNKSPFKTFLQIAGKMQPHCILQIGQMVPLETPLKRRPFIHWLIAMNNELKPTNLSLMKQPNSHILRYINISVHLALWMSRWVSANIIQNHSTIDPSEQRWWHLMNFHWLEAGRLWNEQNEAICFKHSTVSISLANLPQCCTQQAMAWRPDSLPWPTPTRHFCERR